MHIEISNKRIESACDTLIEYYTTTIKTINESSVSFRTGQELQKTKKEAISSLHKERETVYNIKDRVGLTLTEQEFDMIKRYL